MTITVPDVKILKSERLSDYPDGGGKMTGIEVVDGVMNNLFPDISRLDRTYGRVSLRKAFAAIRSLTTDTYYGAHAIITEPPADDAVNVTMFSTNSYPDERTNARDRIESYLTPSIESRFVLFGNHLTGSSLMSVYCDPKVPSPDIGEVYALRHLNQIVDDESAVELYIQYQRIQRVISRVNGDYIVNGSTPPRKVNVDVIVMEVSSIFQQDFPGASPTDVTGSPAKTKINQTSAADAARYYGVTRLAINAVKGEFTFTVADVFASLVPSAQSETTVIDQPGAAQLVVAAASATGSISQTAQPWAGGVDNVSYFPRGFVPGTFSLDGGLTTDDGFGGYDDGFVKATLDYPSGKVTARPSSSTTKVMTATPAAPMSQSGYTSQYGVTAATRSYNFVLSLQPLPAPGSFYADYKSQGKWYRLRDNGLGKLAGDLTSYGSGVIDYTTGSVVITTGALPDVNTAVLYGWGSRENLEILTGSGPNIADNSTILDGPLSYTANGLAPDPSFNVTFSLLGPIAPNTVKLAWQEVTDLYLDVYGQPTFQYIDVTAHDDGMGHLVRPATNLGITACGTINYGTGVVVLHVKTDNPLITYAAGPFVAQFKTGV